MGTYAHQWNLLESLLTMDDTERNTYFHFKALHPIYERWQAINEYNSRIRDRLPKGASRLVFSDWHYNYNDPRCPHDSWIDSIDFNIVGTRSRPRSVTLHLLGAFHDRTISIEYQDVNDLLLEGRLISSRRRDVEWLYDEVHLLDSGRVAHVIEFAECLVRIECSDLVYRFELFEEAVAP